MVITIDINPSAIFALVNAILGWGLGVYISWFAVTKANGKKPIRLIEAGLILYTALIYTLGLTHVIPLDTIGESYLRPFIPILYFAFFWECRAELPAKGH